MLPQLLLSLPPLPAQQTLLVLVVLVLVRALLALEPERRVLPVLRVLLALLALESERRVRLGYSTVFRYSPSHRISACRPVLREPH